ncbi:MAG: ABC transporter permease subunit [Tepidisphaera sp.]|nr:ABC transporter permease subunit [Tepidisphaera sp.]
MSDAAMVPGAEAPPPAPKRLKPTWPSKGPWRRFPGPIVARDVAKSSRRMGTYLTRLAVVGLLLVVLAITYSSAVNMRGFTEDGANDSNIATLQQLQRVAPALVIATVWFEFVILSLLSVSATSMAICGERQAGTLWALLATPLRTWEIVLGKVLAGGAQMLVLALLPLPVLLAVRIFGGVSASTLAYCAAIVGSTALCGLVCGVYASISANRITRAAVSGLALLAFQQFGVPLLGSLVNLLLDTTLMDVRHLPFIMPTFALGWAAFGQDSPVPGVNLGLMVAGAVAWNLGWSGVLFLLSCLRLRSLAAKGRLTMDPAPSGRGRHRAKAGKAAKTSEAPPEAGDAGAVAPEGNQRKLGRATGALEGTSRVVGEHPVRWRECATPLVTKLSLRVVTWMAFIGFGVLDVAYDGVTDSSVHHVVSFLGLLVAVLTTASAASGGFPSERESRTLDILLTTPLSARQIVLGKFVGAMRHAWFGVSVIGAHLVLAWVFGNVIWLTLVYAAMVVVPSVAIAAAVGTLIGLGLRTTQKATMASAAALLLTWGGVPLGMGIAEGIFRNMGLYNTWSQVESVVFTLNPFGMIVMAMQLYGWQSGRVSAGNQVDYFGVGSMSYLAMGTWMGVFALVSLLAALGLLWLASRGLRRIGLRR